MRRNTFIALVAALLVSSVSMDATALTLTTDACNAVWTGKIARLRIYNDTAGQRVFAYIYPGNNENYVGYTTDPNMIQALFRNRDDISGASIAGSTKDCQIKFIDY